MDQLTGILLADEGMDQVMENSKGWKDDALSYLRQYIAALKARNIEEMRWDAFHEWAHAKGLPDPHHPNAWGALTRVARKERLVSSTGIYYRSSRATRHAGAQQLWKLN